MSAIENILKGIRSLFTWWVILAPWEAGLRVRLGKQVMDLTGGIYLRIPAIDRFYVQSIRTRTVDLGIQTITTQDGKTVTIAGVLRYHIADIRKLYETLHHAQDTIADLALAAIADFIVTHKYEDCSPKKLQSAVNGTVDLNQYGLGGGVISITDFAAVKTFRLIKDDKRWSDGDNLKTNREYRPTDGADY